MKSINYSILIPTYNRATRISATIQSVLNQNYRNFELIIVDDGSSDNTQEIVGSLTDARIRNLKKGNKELTFTK